MHDSTRRSRYPRLVFTNGFRNSLAWVAVLISIVIAKPLELKIFESEIEAELVKMQQENYKEQDDLVKDRYLADIDTLKTEIIALKGHCCMNIW